MLHDEGLDDALIARLGLPAASVGWAGRKDRNATARQRLSVPRRESEGRLDALEDPRLRLLGASPHRNKLRLGHLRGNRFRLLLRGSAPLGPLREALDALVATGMPNYFGPQRFGLEGDNHQRGRALLGTPNARRGRAQRFLHSAFQSSLFNRVCAARAAAGPGLLDGDLAWIHAKGAVFRVEDLSAEAPRAERLEISASGPLPGRQMLLPADAAGELEARELALGGWREEFGRQLRGGRRPLRIPLLEASLEAYDEGAQLTVTLPPGSYASVLLACLGLRVPAGGRDSEED